MPYWNHEFWWQPTTAFTITLSYGEFNFSQAKFIDVIFDLIVRHGVQALGVWPVYYLYRGVTRKMMTDAPAPFDKVLRLEYKTWHISRQWSQKRPVR